MNDTDSRLPLPDLENGGAALGPGSSAPGADENVNRAAADLEAVFDVPVKVSAVLTLALLPFLAYLGFSGALTLTSLGGVE